MKLNLHNYKLCVYFKNRKLLKKSRIQAMFLSLVIIIAKIYSKTLILFIIYNIT